MCLTYTDIEVRGSTHACTCKHAWSNRSVQTIKVYFPQVWRGESQGRASVCALVGGCQERLWCKPRTSQIPKFPTGHAAKCTNHKCCASSNRFRILCMSKQKQQCLWVCLHCMSVLAPLFSKWISLPLVLVYVTTTTRETFFFALKNVLFCILVK